MDYKNDFEDLRIKTSLGDIHVRHHTGVRQKLVFLHGFGINSRAWSRLVALLPDDLDVYLMDLLGHGESSAPRIDYTVEKQTEALREVVEKAGISDCYIIGHSYGGWAVLLYAMKGYPAKGFVLENAAGVRDHIAHLESTSSIEAFKENMYRMAMKYAGNRDYVMRSVLDMELQNQSLDSAALSAISKPTLIIWGSDDKLIDKRSADTLSKGIRGSTLEMLESAGHDPHYTKPELVKAALLKFIGYA
jgi:pimeloyl-ACP methyl ester carboxylesterase